MGAVLEYKYLTLLDNENLLSSFLKNVYSFYAILSNHV